MSKKHEFYPFIFSILMVHYSLDSGNKNSTPAGGRIV
jgi:hypothetical protein